MCIKEEGIGELDFAIGSNCCSDAMEDSIVGPRNDLDCGRYFGGCLSGWLDLLAGNCCVSSSRAAIVGPLSFRHVVLGMELLWCC